MEKSADRLINAIRKKADSFKQEEALHAYFASDLMVSKLRKTIEELKRWMSQQRQKTTKAFKISQRGNSG